MTDVRTPDGRTLNVFDSGDPAGKPVLFHHGTPSAGRPFEPHVRTAAERGVRLVSWDRAGYGASSRNEGRSVADAAADALVIADALGIDRFATWGLSGGGPHALATAALGGDRVAAVATMSGVGPFDAADLDWLAGMGQGNIAEFDAARGGEATLRPSLEEQAAGMADVSVPQFIEAMQPHLSEVDAAALDGELGAYFLGSMQEALAGGVEGWLDDDFAFLQPWGFALDEIRQPALVVQGRQDLMVPFAHGEWLVAHVPGAEARLSETEGHLTLFVSETENVHDWLLARF